jgi:hypothetical protein
MAKVPAGITAVAPDRGGEAMLHAASPVAAYSRITEGTQVCSLHVSLWAELDTGLNGPLLDFGRAQGYNSINRIHHINEI